MTTGEECGNCPYGPDWTVVFGQSAQAGHMSWGLSHPPTEPPCDGCVTLCPSRKMGMFPHSWTCKAFTDVMLMYVIE